MYKIKNYKIRLLRKIREIYNKISIHMYMYRMLYIKPADVLSITDSLVKFLKSIFP